MMRSFTVDLGVEVHAVDHGGQGPRLVLVHGLGGSHADWMYVAPALTRDFRVFALDLAGFGHTPAIPPTRATIPANRALLDRFLLEVSGVPAILVGNSMGGLISLLEAALRPEHVAALVLVDPAVPHARGARLDPQVVRMGVVYGIPLLGLRLMQRRMRTVAAERLVRETLTMCFGDPSRLSDEVVQAFAAAARDRAAMPWSVPATRAAGRSLTRMLLVRRRFFRLTGAVRSPTLLIQGERDRLVSPVSARALAARHPDWTLRMLDGLGHTPQIEDPDRFLETVLSWSGRPDVSRALATAGEDALAPAGGSGHLGAAG
ncbi:MAG: alpha/beta hydrolase [Chloroflexi bacterium]|nr:MAG: alpha/beta hydrolase [Chloroflexota bacterium]